MSAEWVMVFITTVYVIATIAICWANIQAAKASKEQLAEMRKQYADENRPNIETEFIYEKKSFYGLRLINHGKKTAQHVRIQLDNEFIQSLTEASFRSLLEKQKDKECIIGVGQHYDLYFGSNQLRSNQNKKPVTGTVSYSSDGQTYQSAIFIDLENYSTIFSVNTIEDDMLEQMKKQTKAMEKIARMLASRNSAEEE